jgi:hypothetical protein
LSLIFLVFLEGETAQRPKVFSGELRLKSLIKLALQKLIDRSELSQETRK